MFCAKLLILLKIFCIMTYFYIYKYTYFIIFRFLIFKRLKKIVLLFRLKIKICIFFYCRKTTYLIGHDWII